MKNNKFSKMNALFQKKGFFIALYSCIAVLLVAAVLITYNSLSIAEGEPGESEIAQGVEVDFDGLQQTSGRGYLTPDDKDGVNVEVATIPDEFTNLTESSVNREQPDSEPEMEQEQPESEENTTSDNETEAPAPEDMDESPEEAYYDDEDTAFVSSSMDEGIEEVLADPVFNVYNGEDDMIWPLEGDIVMGYSVDSVVYDATLDQYRTNDSISIAAGAGSQVKASADGVVKTVSNARESGNFIVIEHGNGWCTTYSQLQDGILVSEGDVVTAGQVIGGVGNPSIYSVLLGNHLNFKVSKDDQTVNPIMILQQ